MVRLALALASILLVTSGCKDKGSPAEPPGAGTAAPAGDGYQAHGKKPENARRPAPPPSLAVLAAGAPAPAISLPDSTGATWTLADALTKWKRVVIVFYRGDW